MSGNQGSARDSSNSLSSIISTLVPVLIISSVIFVVFLILQRKVSRVYHPRSIQDVVPRSDITPAPGSGIFGWLKPYRSSRDAFILQHQSLDGFLFLRYIKLLTFISFVGCCATWPILFPVNATGGGGQQQLDMLSFSNISNANRYYAHALVAWLFLGFIVVTVTREMIFFIGLRQKMFTSSFHAQRLSSRTVLFLDIPKSVNQEKLRQIFGERVRRIWPVFKCDDLEDLVEDRDKLWDKFEKGQQKFILESEKNRQKNKSQSEPGPLRFTEKRPQHRTKMLIGKKVDTIEYGREKLPQMDQEIMKKREQLQNESPAAAFIEFSSQAAAQEAFQLFAKDKRTEFSPRYIGVQPNEVIWKNLTMSKASRKIKMAMATTAIVLLTLFWAIPVAFVGILTNVNYLTENVPFLGFIDDIPKVILGVVTGLLPTVLLVILMALVPIICKLLAKLAGAPTLSIIELKVQSWYFIFQVIQVFLITTFTSGASAVASQIVSNPTQAPILLAHNLPKASNFYISYFILQGLMLAALQLLNLVPLLLNLVLGKFDKTPRKQYNRWITLAGLSYGSMYPKITNMGVIAISYSCIAPLVLGFATIGFGLIYLGFRYNFLFVFGVPVDMKGENYPKALQQLLTGVYLASICLIGLFAIGVSESRAAIGPLVLMVVFLAVLITVHILINVALRPLRNHLPLELLAQNQYSIEEKMEEGEKLEEGEERRVWRPTTDEKDHKSNRLAEIAKKHVSATHDKVQTLLGDEGQDVPDYQGVNLDDAFKQPAFAAEKTFVWLANDHHEVGLTEKLLMENSKAGIDGSKEAAWLDEKDELFTRRCSHPDVCFREHHYHICKKYIKKVRNPDGDSIPACSRGGGGVVHVDSIRTLSECKLPADIACPHGPACYKQGHLYVYLMPNCPSISKPANGYFRGDACNYGHENPAARRRVLFNQEVRAALFRGC